MTSKPALDQRSEARIRRLLAAERSRVEIGERVERFSALFLGKPYRVAPLIGAADRAEVFTISLRFFDCVTYVETVYALARAATAAEFTDGVRDLRYRDGVVSWRARNHYMTDWLRRNVRARRLSMLTPRARRRRLERRLDVVPGLPSRKARLDDYGVKGVLARADEIPTGAIALFVSTRRDLDVFHCGIVVQRDRTTWLRHAARSLGGVIEEPLETFVDRNQMHGIILAAPLPRGRR